MPIPDIALTEIPEVIPDVISPVNVISPLGACVPYPCSDTNLSRGTALATAAAATTAGKITLESGTYDLDGANVTLSTGVLAYGSSDVVITNGSCNVLMADRPIGSNTFLVGPGCAYDTVHAAVEAAVAGSDVMVTPGTYAGSTLTVPTGVNVYGSGINCVLQFNVMLVGTASISRVLMDDGYTITQNGVEY